MFTIVPIFIVIVFVVMIGLMIFSGARYVKNARSPKESVYAKVVAKRMNVRSSSGHHHNDDNGISHTRGSSHTDYYVTLEFEDGSRREYLDVKKLYGLLVEGDEGYAAVQGDWIVAFERQ
ncbi:DUF2500 domain-containing protein [Cohnella soli]|uniref:DUF2500 domain-containing protein n=1 Tax=Cohnella soli TaxID=425005 RepID=A0ABW0HV60_9BACL